MTFHEFYISSCIAALIALILDLKFSEIGNLIKSVAERQGKNFVAIPLMFLVFCPIINTLFVMINIAIIAANIRRK